MKPQEDASTEVAQVEAPPAETAPEAEEAKGPAMLLPLPMAFHPRTPEPVASTCVVCGANGSGGPGDDTRSLCARGQCRFPQGPVPQDGQRLPSHERSQAT